MRYWLLKTEPGCYSLDDLQKDKKTSWGGVRNFQARNFLRDEMKKGDLCLFYHSSVDPPSAVGICEVVREGYPDVTQFDPADDHCDAKSREENPQWFAVDIAYKTTFTVPVTIAAMRANKALRSMKLLAKGSRLSVLPVEKEEFEEVLAMTKR